MRDIIYIGCARNSQEVDGALTLATRTFGSNETTEMSVNAKRRLMSPHGILSEQDVVVLVNRTGEICGTCFLVDRLFYRGKNNVQGTFLSSICIAESSRGKGLSKLLMNATIAECERRGTAFAILIARRAVDHFYNKFSFWGLSQYSKINFKLEDSCALLNNCSFSPATEADLIEVNGMYESTYSGLYGACKRSLEYWKYVLWRTTSQERNFYIYKTQGMVRGYVIFSGSELDELASAQRVSCLGLIKDLARNSSLKEVTLNCSSEHPIVSELHCLDFSVTQRQCNYGGHMVRVINRDVLLRYLAEEIQADCCSFGIENYTEMHGDALIELRNGKVAITLTDSPYSHKNTCLLMGAAYLSEVSSRRSIYKHRYFNVPFFDQV